MAKKISRSGKRYGGSHTTLIPLAAEVCRLIEQHPAVTKIAPGYIAAGLATVRGKRRVKITYRTGGILLSARDNASRQQVHIYTNEPERVVGALVNALRESLIELTFEHG